MKTLVKTGLLLFPLLSTMAIAGAQDKDVIAKMHYTKAEEMYNKGTLLDYEECIEELTKAENELATTNSKILFLKILALSKFKAAYFSKDLDSTLNLFYKITDSKSYPEDKYTQIVRIDAETKGRRLFENSNKVSDEDLILNKAFEGYFVALQELKFPSERPNYNPSWDDAPEKNRKTIKAYAENKNFVYALKWYHHLHKQGNLKATKRIATMFESGFGVYKSDFSAIQYLQQAALKGDVEAMVSLGQILMWKMLNYHTNGSSSCTSRNIPEAVKWFTLAAEKGSVKALRYLGKIYDDSWAPKDDCDEDSHSGLTIGNSEKDNNIKAVEYYKEAASKGDVDSMNALATMYEFGADKGIKKDKKLAEEWKSKANKMMPK